jgi:hypothetical protein
MIDNDFAGKEVLTTEDGSDTATATVYGLLRFDMQEGNGRGITIATVHTNSTDMLAPLDGMILTGINELYPDGTGSVTLWEWQSGIPLPTTTTPEEPPLTDTMTTNATTTTDTDERTAAIPEEGEEQQQQQTTPTAPPNPLFE